MTVTSATTTSTNQELVSLTIDGVDVSVPKGTLLIRAAEQIGIQIPRFCDHPLLDPVGACRQCMVEVATPAPDGTLRPMPKRNSYSRSSIANGYTSSSDLPTALFPTLQESAP